MGKARVDTKPERCVVTMTEEIIDPTTARIEQMSEREAKDVLDRIMQATWIAYETIESGLFEEGSGQFIDGMQEVIDRTFEAFEKGPYTKRPGQE